MNGQQSLEGHWEATSEYHIKLKKIYDLPLIQYFRFAFHHAVWHWGNDSKEGSEHYLNGVQYPAEMQLYHFNTKYSSYDEAAKKPDGLAAVSFFYEISEEANPQQQNLEEAASRLADETRHMGIEFEVGYATGTLDMLLPEGGIQTNDNYFHYDGSLTLPRNSNTTDAEDCNEPVKWIVYEKKIPASEKQLKHFRYLLQVAAADTTFLERYGICGTEVDCSTPTTALGKQLRGCLCAEDLMCVHNFRPIHAINPSITARGLNRMYFCLFIDCVMFLCFR